MLHIADWIILLTTLVLIIMYGLYRSRASKNLDGYFRSNRQLPWYMVLLSIMGTQASAITFLAGPGQAYTDGMRFVQYYFGIPLAMIVICITFVPIFKKLNLFTAYEFLEKRFDKKTRTFTSFLFLLSRGLSTGISVVAPSLVLSAMLGWNIYLTNIVMGGILIIYTVSGGARAVAYTQQIQFIVITIGMFLAGYFAVHLLPDGVGFKEALQAGGDLGRMNIITDGIKPDTGRFNWDDRYNIFSGIIGGFFLAWSYFGTDQSQVGRYLTSKSIRESRMGLLMNGLVKIPMQFLILLVGVLVFAYYQYNKEPIHFNKLAHEQLMKTEYADSALHLERLYDSVATEKQQLMRLVQTDSFFHLTYPNTRSNKERDEMTGKKLMLAVKKDMQHYQDSLRGMYRNYMKKGKVSAEANDVNYIFFRFVTDHLPVGVIGLLIAMIFLASWGSIAAALNALASATIIDFHKQYAKAPLSTGREYRLSKMYTLAWGIFCIITAQFATNMGSLIEAVNILGSLFYGVMLGIFIIAFYFKNVKADAVFISAIIGELFICTLHFGFHFKGFLWLNVFGAVAVVVLALLLQALWNSSQNHVNKRPL
jgi:solute:Na+ symporter, SSS family